MNIIRNITVVFLCCLFFTLSSAGQTKETFSYIYIQSDKDLPFYVKYEDEMLPRYGKNYSIISELAPGTANLQILFQQHTLPPVKFTVKIPENGFRGFLLTKKSDAFSLYDIHQKFYLSAGNNASDDQLPTFNQSQRIPEPPKAAIQPEVPKSVPITPPTTEKPKPAKQETIKEKEPAKPKTEAVVTTPSPTPPPVVTPAPKTEPPVAKPSAPITTPPATPAANTQTPGKDPQFIDNIALENERTAGNTVPKPRRGIVVVNSDCPEPISEEAFADLERKLNERFGDDRLRYVLGKMDNCYTTAQMRTLARSMNSDAERYTLLKKAYSRVTDQSVFHILEREFTEPEWKEYFRAIIKK